MSVAAGGSTLDRVLYALFSRHADRPRHDRDRRRYRGTDMGASFEVYVARTYALSLGVAAVAFIGVLAVGLTLPDRTVLALDAVLAGIAPDPGVALPTVPRPYTATLVGVVAGAGARRGTLLAAGQYLAWRARARRNDIERTLPGAVRYLRTLTSGCDDPREMLRKVADNEDAYGETAVACRKVLNRAALTGGLGEALRGAAKDTPSRDALAPFLLKFREHAEQGPDELRAYLKLEGRMLSHHQAVARERATSFLELVAEVFVVVLVVPALLVIVVTVMGVLAPGLGAELSTPFGPTTRRTLLFYGCVVFVLGTGLLAALVVDSLRPRALSTVSYEPPRRPAELVGTALVNPASAAVVLLPFGVCVGVLTALGDARPVVAVLAGYVAYALPVGVVGVRRARLDDAKDRQIKDFVHAVAGHVSLGRPLPEAVEVVASDVDLGPLNGDVADLALNANLSTAPDDSVDRRTAALDRFVENVGTPLAEQTMGLVTGALDAGSDTDEVFETLQSEVGRLHHEKRALRSNMLVYVAVGWTTALLIVGIMVSVDAYILEGFARLDDAATGGALVVDAGGIQPARDRFRFYLVTQATMLACGWFAGAASRGYYEALLHSAALVVVTHAVFAGVAGL